jgi:hypothetical protein
VKWKLSLKFIFLFFLYLSFCDICSDGCNECCSVTRVLWLMNNCAVSLLFASRILPDKKIESIVKKSCNR